jgi:aspartyl/asparaginyl beta-hydroxylase (cupin superfamily)
MDEYVDSQFNGGEWHTNDSSPSLSTKEERSQANETVSEDSSAMPQWEVLYLMNQGQWIDSNIKRCPQTYQLLQKIPSYDLMAGCMFGNIFFSVLYPGTKIDIHCGPTNVRHRLHFPLVVSQKKESKRTKNHADCSKCIPFLKVDDETLHWVEGEPFVFDDSLAHSAEYPDSDDQSVRVVLVVDLWHKDLKLKERELIHNLYPSALPES